jgi:hypothetical protein
VKFDNERWKAYSSELFATLEEAQAECCRLNEEEKKMLDTLQDGWD